jgi:ribosome maturation factor RimP
MDDGAKREGILSSITEDAIVIDEKVKEKGKKAVEMESIIPLNKITETKVLVSFK